MLTDAALQVAAVASAVTAVLLAVLLGLVALDRRRR